ncbi:MAG: sensor histidine kinase KdpD, partial [Verrucomicrobia bacterium]|nr:sensor histidine kinase KdpD [Verrucomicrobiota bacterium]
MSEDARSNPDALLAAVQRDERQQRRGHLKVFLGMSPGVGKTYAMLEAAQRERRAGRDVVVGHVESHGRPETDALLAGLPVLPHRTSESRGVAFSELDLDALLARRPQLAIVDELAHSNAPGSRHPKRHQDVTELLDAGMDVFTTLNVQHVESRAETVREITGAAVRETVPDSVLDDAEIELVDLPPAELLDRLNAGKVYVPERAAEAMRHFFREGNLMALRELALRLAAEHAGQDTRLFRAAHAIARVWKTGPRLLVAISPSPLSASMARWTRRLSDSLHAPWLAVHVDTGRGLSEEDQRRLRSHLTLARELGAEVLTTTDQDVVQGLLRVARQHNVTQIVAGKPVGGWLSGLLRGGPVLDRLIRESGDMDVICVRAEPVGALEPRGRPVLDAAASGQQYAVAAGVVAAITLLNGLVGKWTGHYTPSLIYLLAVVGLALFVGRGPTLFAAAAGALLWNFLFLPPTYTLYITSVQDALMFGMFFAVALAMGQLTTRLRTQQLAERERERQATALYLLTRELADVRDLPELLGVVVRQVGAAFASEVAVLLPDPSPDAAAPLVAYPFGTLTLSEKEAGVADWAYRNARPAGWTTDTLPSAGALYLPLVSPAGCLGVVGLRPKHAGELTVSQRTLLEGFLRQIGLVVDRQRLRDAEQDARLLAESERLGRTLVNSVSHELRTPLAAITSATEALAASGSLAPSQAALIGETREAAERLNRLVRNLLDTARLEAGPVRPRCDWCDPADLCRSAARETSAALAHHRFCMEAMEGLPLVRVDAVLLEQALANLLVNAARHTPPGTEVALRALASGGDLVFEVADRGPGLGAGNPTVLFERFRRLDSAPAGGLGLGLSIVRGFVLAHGGRV